MPPAEGRIAIPSRTTAPLAPEQAEQSRQPTAKTEEASARGLRLVHIWAIVPLALAWFLSSIDFIEPYDFWWNLKSGQIMMQTGRFLATDVLVYTPVREPYYNPQWGSQLLFYWFYSISPYLLLALRAAIITATMALILKLCACKSGSLRAAAVATVIVCLASETNFGMRPQLFAFLPFIGFYFLLERKDSHPRWLPLLVPIMAFWVSVHGSFFLGVAMLGIYGLGALLEKLPSAEGRKWLVSRAAGWQAVWFILAALASLINPYLLGIYNYFLVATNDPIARALNEEWQSPTLSQGTGILFFSVVLIYLASAYISRRRMRSTEILLLLAFGYLALTSLRNVIWWTWIVAPAIASNFVTIAANRKIKWPQVEADLTDSEASKAGEAPTLRKEPAVLNWGMAVILVGVPLLFTPLWRQSNPLVAPASKGFVTKDTPTGIAAFLQKNHVPAPMFNYMEWGGYLENELYPQYQLFIDGRFEARQISVWNDYLSISRARVDWQQTLDKYNIRTLVLNKDFDKNLIPFVGASPLWHKVYDDKLGMVFVRG